MLHLRPKRWSDQNCHFPTPASRTRRRAGATAYALLIENVTRTSFMPPLCQGYRNKLPLRRYSGLGMVR